MSPLIQPFLFQKTSLELWAFILCVLLIFTRPGQWLLRAVLWIILSIGLCVLVPVSFVCFSLDYGLRRLCGGGKNPVLDLVPDTLAHGLGVIKTRRDSLWDTLRHGPRAGARHLVLIVLLLTGGSQWPAIVSWLEMTFKTVKKEETQISLTKTPLKPPTTSARKTLPVEFPKPVPLRASTERLKPPAPGILYDPGFPCAPDGAVQTKTEKTICANAHLAGLSRKMLSLYHARMQKLPKPLQSSLRREQEEWRMNKRNRCGAYTACIARAFKNRTADLAKWEATAPVSSRQLANRQTAQKKEQPGTPLVSPNNPKRFAVPLPPSRTELYPYRVVGAYYPYNKDIGLPVVWNPQNHQYCIAAHDPSHNHVYYMPAKPYRFNQYIPDGQWQQSCDD